MKMVYPFAITVSLTLFFFKILREAYVNRNKGRNLVFGEVVKQTYFTGVQALGLVTALAAIVGVGVGIEISAILAAIGNPAMINKIFYDLVIREIAPLATAMIIVGRSGAAVATELATITVNKEIETYKSLGINIHHFLLYPRLFGITLSTIALSSYFAAVAIMMGAFLVYIQSGVPFTTYIARVTEEGRYSDVIVFFIKSALNGISIAIISCWMGLKVKPSPTEIPRAASGAVILCGVSIIVISGLVTFLAYV